MDVEITAEIRAFIDKAAVGVELAEDEGAYRSVRRSHPL